MTMLLMTALMTMQLAADVATIERLSPRAAGDLTLAGRDHGPIETVERTPMIGPWLPGEVEFQMVERADITPAGCMRKRWRVYIDHAGADRSVETSRSIYGATEIAAPAGRSCPDKGYASLAGITPAQAFTALSRLDAIRSRAPKIAIACADETRSGLCANSRAIAEGLSKVSPWHVKRENRSIILWLGDQSNMVTEVRWNDDSRDRVSVDRRIPAPF